MGSFVNNLLQNYVANHSQQNQQNGSLLGSGPTDWLTNAIAFAGTDALLNRYDEDHEKNNIHFWRNAGLAGALALGYQYYKNHYGQNSNNMPTLSNEQLQQLVQQQQQVAPTTPASAPTTPVPPQPPQALTYYYPQQPLPMMPPPPLNEGYYFHPSMMVPPAPQFYGPHLAPYYQQQQDPYSMYYQQQQLMMQQQQQLFQLQQLNQQPYFGNSMIQQPPFVNGNNIMGPWPIMTPYYPQQQQAFYRSHYNPYML